MSSLSLVSQEVASSARLVFQAAETEGKRLRAHRLQLLGEKCLEIVVISEGSGGGGGAGKKKKKKKSCLGLCLPSGFSWNKKKKVS